MALNAYLRLKGTKQGVIQGSSTQKGREGKIVVVASNHEVIAPVDPASGLPTGRRQHKPFVITKEVDKASPLLYTALVTNEQITEWELQFWHPAQTGAETQYYTVKLTNAAIRSIQFTMADNRNTELQRYAPYEEVSFTYQKIEWIWTDGGITASDDWGELQA